MRPQNASMKDRAHSMAIRRWALHPNVLPPRREADEAKNSARLAMQLTYQGSDCRRKHGGLRYSSTGQCVLCLKARER